MKAKTSLVFVLTAALLPLLGVALAQEPALNHQVDAGVAPAPQQEPTDCLAIHFTHPTWGDGYYTIDPDGAGGNPPLEAYCDMSTDEGGWTVIDYNHASGWRDYFTSWQVIDGGRIAMPTAEGFPSPSYQYWTIWFAPAETDTRFRKSPLCQEVTPTTQDLAQAYVTTGNFYGCTWYNRNCDMDPVTQECFSCMDDYGQYRPGTCSHRGYGSSGSWNGIYEGYPYSCSGDWWNRAPAVGIAGQFCVAYRTSYSMPIDAHKTASAAAVAPGGTIAYTVELHWDSESGEPADSTLSDPLPQYTEYVPGSAWASLGSVDVSDPSRITWSGSIPDGVTATIRYSLRVPCAGLMDRPMQEWPAALVNQATGHIGAQEYTASASVELVKPDLEITGLELTQAVQNLANAVPLIKGKETYARLYIRATYPDGFAGCDVPEVTARLEGAPGSPLTPIDESVTARVLAGQDRPTLAERDDMGQSLFFWLPWSWYNHAGNYVLTARINPTGERPDADLTNNTWSQNVTLSRTRQLPLYLVPVRYTVLSPPPLPDKDDTIRALQMIRMWPIAYENLDIRWLRPYELPYTLRYDVPQYMFLSSLHWRYAADSRLKRGHYLAVVPGVVPTEDTNGVAFRPGKVAWVLLQADLQAAGGSLVHELSHNLGRMHVRCPDDISNPDPNWPAAYPPCQLSDGARDSYYGFDSWPVPRERVRNPRTYGDIMTYAANRWISDYTYRGVYEQLKPTAGLGEAETLAQGDRLLISGVITPGLSAASLEYVYLSDNTNWTNDEVTGTYTLELQDAGGQVLVSDTFGVWVTEEGGGAALTTSLPFLRALPANPLAARVVLKDGDTVLATRLASSTPPTVTWTAPNGGGVLSGTVELSWTGHDADGDPLTYIVQYSADGGATWQPIAIHITGTQTTADMAEFPGGDQCLFRVIASDGFYTAVDQADGFSTAARQAPIAYILAPEEGQRYPASQPMTFHGGGHDQDLDTLSGASLVWTSDRDGALGAGSPLEATLSLGCHVVTLTATDDRGLSATDEVHFCVGFWVYLPLVQR